MVEQKIKEVESSAKSKIEAAVLKSVKDFQASTEFLNEKADFASNACGIEKQFIRDSRYPIS